MLVAACGPAAAQDQVTQADIQRLQDNIYLAERDITQVRGRDSARATQLQSELDDLRDEVMYLKVKLRKERTLAPPSTRMCATESRTCARARANSATASTARLRLPLRTGATPAPGTPRRAGPGPGVRTPGAHSTNREIPSAPSSTSGCRTT